MESQMKRIYMPAFLWSLIVWAVIWSGSGYAAVKDSPRSIAESYFSGLKTGNEAKIDSGLSSQVLEAKKNGFLKFTGEVFRDAEFIPEETVIQSETARVKAKLVRPFYSLMANTVIKVEDVDILYEKPAIEDVGQGKDVVGNQSASIQRRGLPRKKVESNFELALISEDGSWKINFDDPMPTIENNLKSILAIGIRRPEYENRRYEITLMDGRTYVIDRAHYEEISRKWLVMADKEEAAYWADKRVRDEILSEKREAGQKNTRIEYVVHGGPAGDIRNWERLSKGMSQEEVKQILGEAESEGAEEVNGQKYKTWKYPKGQVYFLKKKAVQWKAPLAKRVRIDPDFERMEVSEDEIQYRIQAYINAYQPKAPASLDDRMRGGILEAKETIKMMSKYLRIPSSDMQK